jgi:hypothetical protein
MSRRPTTAKAVSPRAPGALPHVSAMSLPNRARPDAAKSAAPALRTAGAARTFPRRVRRSAPRALVLAGGVLVALLLLSQALLPRLAEREVRGALGPQARGVHVAIAATPAVKLLWHRADRVTITVDRLQPRASGGGSTGEILAGLNVARKLDLRIGDLQAHGVHLRGVNVHKDGPTVAAHADVDLRVLQGLLPRGLRVEPLSAPNGEIRLDGRLTVLGSRVHARGALLADRGRIVVRPEGLPFGSLVSVPLFSDDRLAVDGVGARESDDGVVLSARGHLRDA